MNKSKLAADELAVLGQDSINLDLIVDLYIEIGQYKSSRHRARSMTLLDPPEHGSEHITINSIWVSDLPIGAREYLVAGKAVTAKVRLSRLEGDVYSSDETPDIMAVIANVKTVSGDEDSGTAVYELVFKEGCEVIQEHY